MMDQNLINEWLRTGASCAALAIACLSLWFTRKLWVQSNRPVVTAGVQTSKGGNQAIAFDLVVTNSGTRPAVMVGLAVLDEHLQEALEASASQNKDLAPLVREIHRCFSSEAIIPLLLAGQTVRNAFGYTGNQLGAGSIWKVGAIIPIEIAYRDLENRSFKSKLTLVIRDSNGFAGSFWGHSK